VRAGRRTAVAAIAALLLAQPLLSGHNGVVAVVTVTPGRPIAGEASRVTVVALGPTGALALPGQRLRLIGEMTGHAMPPLRAELQPGAIKGLYVGELSFTMAGPWKMTLEIDQQGETMWATFGMEAGSEGDATGAPRRYDLEMLDPVQPTLFSPTWVVLVAVGLTVAAEGTAIAFRLRRRRRERQRPAAPAMPVRTA
jgi:hypothetical protein